MIRRPFACAAASALVLASLTAGAQQQPTPAAAAAPDRPSHEALVGDRFAEGTSGRVAINQAAGEGNVQANLAAIAVGGSVEVASAARQQAGAGDPKRDAHARIDGAAFGESHGLLAINQAAGGGNVQANLVAIGQGDTSVAIAGIAQTVTGLADAALADVAASGPGATPSAPADTPRREALIGGDAFARSQGLVQVNQSAGVGNASANAIVLLLPAGGP